MDLTATQTDGVMNRNGFQIINQLGTGSFSTVFLGYNIQDGPARKYAMKLTNYSERSEHEAEILKKLNMDNVIKCIATFKSGPHMCIILDYCDLGDLQKYLQKKNRINETMVQIVMQHMALALRHLQQFNICHNDIKPSNILISSVPRLTFKLADFGIARVFVADEIEKWRDDGTRVYTAPEKLLGNPYDTRTDLWSLGIVMFQCLFGKPSYFQTSLNVIKTQMATGCIIKIPANSHLSPSCEDLLRHLLQINPEERITFQDLFSHCFIDINNIQSTENYLKIIGMFTQAIELDGLKRYEECLQIYQKALGLLYPYMETEPEADRLEIETKYNEYLSRVNELSQIAGVSNITIPASSFDQLKKLAKSTPSLATGIDIAVVAEYYLAQGENYTAFTTLEEALNILMPACVSEPKGFRKLLLLPQVERWINMAESIKSVAEITD